MDICARDIIKSGYGNSKNFMTTHIISYGKISKNMAYELSWGEGIFNRDKRIFGVSVVQLTKEGFFKKMPEISSSFDSLEDAKWYIKKLKKEYKKHE